MKKFSILLIILLCGVVLAFSYASWKEKLASAGKPVKETTSINLPKETPKDIETVISETPDIDWDKLTAGMDPPVQELFMSRKEQGEKIQFLILGSEVMESGEPGYGQLLSEALETSYAGFVETELYSFNGTSEEFLMSEPQLSAGYDVVLMEPFTLKNNGLITIEDEHIHIQHVMDEILSIEDDAVLVLHPPQPIYGAQFYKTQVSALETFAEKRNTAYINHWLQWPSTEDTLIKDYLTEESNPNNIGAETWANALIAYFTGS